MRLIAADARPVDQTALVQDAPVCICLRVADLTEELVERLDQLLKDSAGARPVWFELEGADGTVTTVETGRQVRLSPALLRQLRQLCGPEAIRADF